MLKKMVAEIPDEDNVEFSMERRNGKFVHNPNPVVDVYKSILVPNTFYVSVKKRRFIGQFLHLFTSKLIAAVLLLIFAGIAKAEGLSTMTENVICYWLTDEPSADLNGDGIVNFCDLAIAANETEVTEKKLKVTLGGLIHYGIGQQLLTAPHSCEDAQWDRQIRQWLAVYQNLKSGG